MAVFVLVAAAVAMAGVVLAILNRRRINRQAEQIKRLERRVADRLDLEDRLDALDARAEAIEKQKRWPGLNAFVGVPFMWAAVEARRRPFVTATIVASLLVVLGVAAAFDRGLRVVDPAVSPPAATRLVPEPVPVPVPVPSTAPAAAPALPGFVRGVVRVTRPVGSIQPQPAAVSPVSVAVPPTSSPTGGPAAVVSTAPAPTREGCPLDLSVGLLGLRVCA